MSSRKKSMRVTTNKGQSRMVAKTKVPRKRTKRSGTQSLGFGTSSSARNVTAPSSIGLVIPKSYFTISGSAQQNTEYSGMHDGVRVSGCDLMSQAIQAGTTGGSDIPGPFAGSYYLSLDPSAISPRLEQFEELYQYYAIRKVQIIYAPLVGTSTGVNVALAVVQNTDADYYNIATPSQQQVLEFDPSFLVSTWNIASCEYTHTGTKVWMTSSRSTGDPSEYNQADIVGALNGATSGTVYGSLWLQYTVDFYKPAAPSTTDPSLVLSRAIKQLRSHSVSTTKILDCMKLFHGLLQSPDGSLSSLSLIPHSRVRRHTVDAPSTSSDCASDCKVSDEPVVVQEPLSSLRRDSDLTTGAAATRASSKERPALQRASTSASSSYFNFSSTAVPK